MRGGGCGVSANEYSFAHKAQINFGDLTRYLNYVMYLCIHLWWEGWDIQEGLEELDRQVIVLEESLFYVVSESARVAGSQPMRTALHIKLK